MNPQVIQFWGTHSLQIKLPVASVLLTGLSASQLASLEESYQSFTAEPTQLTGAYDIECRAYRLEHLPAISARALTFDGQYAPRKIRQSDDIDVNGINFKAQIPLKNSHKPASLGVVEENELAGVDVIENFLRVLAAHRALDQGGAVLHSAGLVFDEQAYIFSGRSNAGKTTLTRKAYKQGARVLSDDINVLLPGEGGYQAHAVPFTGEFGRTLDHRGGRDAYPVAGIVLLEQGDCLKTEPVSASQAVARLLTGCPFVNTDAEESAALFDAVTGLVAQVPVIRLISSRDDSIDDIMAAVTKRLQSVTG